VVGGGGGGGGEIFTYLSFFTAKELLELLSKYYDYHRARSNSSAAIRR